MFYNSTKNKGQSQPLTISRAISVFAVFLPILLLPIHDAWALPGTKQGMYLGSTDQQTITVSPGAVQVIRDPSRLIAPIQFTPFIANGSPKGWHYVLVSAPTSGQAFLTAANFSVTTIPPVLRTDSKYLGFYSTPSSSSIHQRCIGAFYYDPFPPAAYQPGIFAFQTDSRVFRFLDAHIIVHDSINPPPGSINPDPTPTLPNGLDVDLQVPHVITKSAIVFATGRLQVPITGDWSLLRYRVPGLPGIGSTIFSFVQSLGDGGDSLSIEIPVNELGKVNFIPDQTGSTQQNVSLSVRLNGYVLGQTVGDSP
jgi:hypothetical protein